MWVMTPPPFPDRATLQEIPAGVEGTRATLAVMRKLVREAKILPVIRNLAVIIIAGLPHKAYAEQAAAVQRWVRSNVQYVRDVRGVETITPPAYLVRTRAGDCDDQATFVASLLESIGLPTRLVAGGPNEQTYVHVWAEVEIGGKWCACETTEPFRFGQRPSFRCYLVLHV